MLGILLGCASFILMYLFDLFTLKKKRFLKVTCGLSGLGLFIYAVVLTYHHSEIIDLPLGVTLPFGILTILFFILLIYSVFVEVNFTKTYTQKEHHTGLVDTGTYALCRHPGVIWFLLFFICAFLATGRSDLFLAASIWTVINIFYVVLQEITIFPYLFSDYSNYQETTPFLIPTIKSIKKMVKTIGG